FGCGAERRGEPEAAAVRPDTRKEVRGERLFPASATHATPAAGPAPVRPSTTNPLPSFPSKTKSGKAAAPMPPSPNAPLTDADVNSIVAYVHELRSSPASD